MAGQLGYIGNRLQYAVVPLNSSTTVNLLSAPNVILVGLINQSVSAQASPIAFYDSGSTTTSGMPLIINWQPSGGQVKWFGLGETMGIDLANGLTADPGGTTNTDGGILVIYGQFNG